MLRSVVVSIMGFCSRMPMMSIYVTCESVVSLFPFFHLKSLDMIVWINACMLYFCMVAYPHKYSAIGLTSPDSVFPFPFQMLSFYFQFFAWFPPLCTPSPLPLPTNGIEMYSPTCRAFSLFGPLLTAHNWQKWKRVFLTCPCHEIYRDEAVGLKSCKYTWKIMIFVKMWNLG